MMFNFEIIYLIWYNTEHATFFNSVLWGYFYVLAYKIDLWFHSKIIFVSRLKASKFSSQELRIL